MRKRTKYFMLFILHLLLILNGTCEKDEIIIVTDIEGNVYNGVKIGDQVWMAENLNTTKYNDGTDIPNVTDDTAWESLKTGAYCFYDNNEANSDIYGRLYNWFVVSTGKLCPTGWHVPTDPEWTIMTEHLGGLSVASGKMKEAGTTHWNNPNTGATNASGFTALPGGHRYFFGQFEGINTGALWWSFTEYNTNQAWFRSIGYDNTGVRRDPYSKQNGFSVRCIRD